MWTWVDLKPMKWHKQLEYELCLSSYLTFGGILKLPAPAYIMGQQI